MALIADLGYADTVERVNIVAIAVEEVVNAIVVPHWYSLIEGDERKDNGEGSKKGRERWIVR
jgi:hypothetical protein